jgi:hypothetical protein
MHILFWISVLIFFTVLRVFERGLKIVLIDNLLFLLTDIPMNKKSIYMTI